MIRKIYNPYDELKKLIEQYQNYEKKPTLLLHSCCGPCSSYVLEMLNQAFDITIYYYNPNIYPSEEYDKRLKEQQVVVNIVNPNIKIIPFKEDYQVYENAIKGNEHLKEGSMRCFECYKFRIASAAKLACENGFDYFTTTLSISPYKNSEWINEIGKMYETNNCKWLYSNFKKDSGYQKSIAFCKKYHIYRQDYCGCKYSLKEHEERINLKKEN